MLDRSPLVRKLVEGNTNSVGFWINGNWYERYYLLDDCIYPKWSCFVQSLHDPEDQKKSNFSGAQKSARKDVKRCFGVMQAWWSIITQPCRLWNTSNISDVMYACIIIHNMIIEDESGRDLKILTQEVASSSSSGMRRGFTFADLTRETALIEDTDTYYNLRDDLVQYLWEHKGLNVY